MAKGYCDDQRTWALEAQSSTGVNLCSVSEMFHHLNRPPKNKSWMTARGATFLLYASPCTVEVHLLPLYDRHHHSTAATEWGTRLIALDSYVHFQPFQRLPVAVLEASCSWVRFLDSSHRYYPSLNYEG